MSHSEKIDALLKIAAGEPDWVLVDRRVLNILLGPLTDLIVKVPYGAEPYGGNVPGLDYTVLSRMHERREYDPDNDGYIWDDDPLCNGD